MTAEVIEWRDAVRGPSRLMLGFGGPSGSGKTYSALRVATGLAEGGLVFGLDTEEGRMAQYADRFRFKHALLSEPHDPARYLAYLQDAEARGAAVIVVDSMSHAHQWVLDRHAELVKAKAGGDGARAERIKFGLWGEAKASHRTFVRWLQKQRKAHIVFCFRARDRTVMRKNERGQEVPTKIGWDPITTEDLDYELGFTFLLPPGGKGHIDLKETATKLDGIGFPWIEDGMLLDERFGQRLATWSRGAAPVEARPSIDNDLPTDHKGLTRSRALLAQLRAVQTPEALAVYATGEEDQMLLSWLQDKQPGWFEILEEARVAAQRRVTEAAVAA